MHGQFFWYDLMTENPAAAAVFYGKVAGWGTQASGQSDMPYTLFTAAGRPVAGLMGYPETLQGPARRPVWMGYVAVDDVDAAAKQLKSLGGTIHREPCDVPGVIRFAVVADPQGAAFYLARGLTESPPPAPPEGTPGTVGWRELYAVDWEKVFPFYETMFGWSRTTSIDMGPAGSYQLFAVDGTDIGGMMTMPPVVPQAYWGYYVNVEAIDAAIDRLTEAGGKVVFGPEQVPGGQWIVQAVDPQGARFNLVAMAR